MEQEEDFTVLPNVIETNGKTKKSKDLYRLPEWMSSFAKHFDSSDLNNENRLHVDQLTYLDENLRKILINDLSIDHLFPVQAQVIPYLIENERRHSILPRCDVCVSSPTGSGKTLTYVIPLVECLRQRVTRSIRAVILLPVQDLAEQVHQVVQKLSNRFELRSALLSGQQSFEEEQKLLVQQKLTGGWTSSVDIVVCTPGRLVEHISRTEGFRLENLRYLIIDEADRIIDEFKQDWLNMLDRAVGYSKEDFQPYMLNSMNGSNRSYQKLLFSATLTHNPEILQQLHLFRPVLFASSSKSSIVMPKTLREQFLICSITYKPLIIAYLVLNELHSERILIFVHSKKDVERLYTLLKLLLPKEISVSQISRNLASNKIQQRLSMFEKGQIQLLVCSDVLARGIDIPNVDCVILYDLPRSIRNYTHRIGRTARAGKKGRSITLVEKERLPLFQSSIKFHRKNKIKPLIVQKKDFAPMLDNYQQALEKFTEKQQKKKSKKKN